MKKLLLVYTLLCISQVTQSSESLNIKQYKQDSNQIIKDINTVNLEEELIKDSNDFNTHMYKLRDLVSLSLNDYYKLNDEIFNVACNELLSLIDTKLDIDIDINNKNISSEDKNVLYKIFGDKTTEIIKLITLLQHMKQFLNNSMQNSITKCSDIRKNNNKDNKVIRTQDIKDILNNIFQYNEILNTLLPIIQNSLKDLKYKDNKYISSIITIFPNINNESKYLLTPYNSFLEDHNIEKISNYNIDKSNSISDDDLYELITYFENENRYITRDINAMLIGSIRLIKSMKQNVVRDFDKYYDNLKTMEIINNDNVLIVKYLDKYDNKCSNNFIYYLENIILRNLSLFNYKNINTNNIQERNTLLKKIINEMNEYTKTINNIENIKVQNCIINKNNINPEYVEKYTQIINEFAKNISKTCEKCKLLINNIKNKAKELLKINDISLLKYSQDNTKNTDTLQNNIYVKLNNIQDYF